MDAFLRSARVFVSFDFSTSSTVVKELTTDFSDSLAEPKGLAEFIGSAEFKGLTGSVDLANSTDLIDSTSLAGSVGFVDSMGLIGSTGLDNTTGLATSLGLVGAEGAFESDTAGVLTADIAGVFEAGAVVWILPEVLEAGAVVWILPEVLIWNFKFAEVGPKFSFFSSAKTSMASTFCFGFLAASSAAFFSASAFSLAACSARAFSISSAASAADLEISELFADKPVNSAGVVICSSGRTVRKSFWNGMTFPFTYSYSYFLPNPRMIKTTPGKKIAKILI